MNLRVLILIAVVFYVQKIFQFFAHEVPLERQYAIQASLQANFQNMSLMANWPATSEITGFGQILELSDGKILLINKRNLRFVRIEGLAGVGASLNMFGVLVYYTNTTSSTKRIIELGIYTLFSGLLDRGQMLFVRPNFLQKTSGCFAGNFANKP